MLVRTIYHKDNPTKQFLYVPPCITHALLLIVEVTCTLRGVTVNNGSTLKSSDIGEDEDALICRTSNDDCCKRPARGECYGPDGSSVARKMDNEKLYRNRGNQVIRLNGRQYGNTPLMGVYRCCLPNECDEDVCFHINLGE